MKRIIYYLFFLLYKTALISQCENRCLHFDGINDFLRIPNLTLSAKTIPASSSFTIEMWFNVDNICSGSTEPTLIEFTPISTPTIPWGIFYCNSKFTLYRGAIPLATSTITLSSGEWHHIALVVTGITVTVYLDGAIILPLNLSTNININQIFIGSKNTTSTIIPNSFNGSIDEIRIWNGARTKPEIINSFHCVCNSSEPNLVCCIPLDQGIAAGNNSGMLPIANDIAIASLQQFANNGVIGNFNLGLSSPRDISNFICSNNKDLLYPNYQNAEIKYFDYLSQNMEINSICSGDALNIKLMKDGQIVNFPNAPIQMVFDWQELVSGNWVTVTSFVPVPGFAIPIAPQTLFANCAGSPNAFDYKIFRIQFTLTDPSGGSCIYYSKESALYICCPLSDFSLNVTSNNSSNLYCQSVAASFTASIVSPDLFVTGNVQIQWFVNNVLQTGATGLIFNYNPSTVPANLCFKAVLKNCNCPAVQKEVCFQADPQPNCAGSLTVDPEPEVKVITLNLDYQICSGSDARLRLTPTAGYFNGILKWEYEFPNIFPTIWHSLGTSNYFQSTNILPQQIPPNSPNPSIWPTGETCIRYRVINCPLSNPSGCVACTSNIVRICLRPDPPVTTINGNNMICVGGSTVLTVNPVVTGYSYTWFLNGQAIGFTGTSYNATQPGNYWVEITSTGMSCLPKQSSTFTLMICKITPLIKCPPCARIGQSISLDASLSQDDCNKPLQYSWRANNGSPLTFNGNPFVHNIGSPNTTYTLTVTNSIGCSATTTITLKACPN